jgi:preprotein translocase subunit SecF
MLTLPNIYNGKYVRYYIVIPLVLLALGLFYSTHIVLDSSLSGGVSVIVQSNTTVPSQQIASEIAAKLHSPQPSIERSPGGLQITIASNQSLISAQGKSLEFFAFQENYTKGLLNVSTYSSLLKTNSTNQTDIQGLAAASRQVNSSLLMMSSSLSDELSDLRPFIGTVQVPSSPNAQLALAQSSYSNASTIYTNTVISTLHSIIPFTTYSYQNLGPTLGSYFLSQLEWVIIAAFVLVSIAVLFIFRSVVPALTVVFGAANDMIIALGAMGLLGIPLGTASIGGLLMIIGYSIDTDVLASFRILKMHGGTPEERAHSSMKTGLTMTATALVSFSVLFVVSIFTYVPTYYEVAGVALCGLLGDIFTTWLGNTPIILLYKKRKDRS